MFSEKVRSVVALLAALMVAEGGVVVALPDWNINKPNVIGGLLMAGGGVILTWVVRGYQALAEQYEPKRRRDQADA